MKIKQQPDDFQVEELTDVVPGTAGDFALYRLEKRGWTTPDALGVIRRRWRLETRRLSHGGLKDRYGRTVQYLTILRGPQRVLHQQGIALSYLGQVAEPYTSTAIRSNRFEVTLRDLHDAQAAAAEDALGTVQVEGVPNYFDDQRFGSVGQGEFVARRMVLGQFERALRLALTAAYEFDRAVVKKEKSILKKHWGDWTACLRWLPGGHARSLVGYLNDNPEDYRGALERLRPELRGLFLSAYQSHLWNRLLARWLESHCRPDQLRSVSLRLGSVPIHQGLGEQERLALAALHLPLPTARTPLAEDDPIAPLARAVLAEEGLVWEQLKLDGFQRLFFSRGDRAALFVPAALTGRVERDEHHPGRSKLQLEFELPRGSYATMLVKRLTLCQ